MLKVIPDAATSPARPPLGLALVIDTSGSMREYADQAAAQQEAERTGVQGKPKMSADGGFQAFELALPSKLDQAIEAGHTLLDDARLQPTDKLAIIHFDDQADVLLQLSPLAERSAAHQAVDTLRQYAGGTHMGKGMQRAADELHAIPVEHVKRLVLLSDGRTFDEPDCAPIATQLGQANTPIIAIGIGDEYNVDLMLELAQVSQGRAYHLETMAQLSSYLELELGISVREVVTDLQASVPTVKGVTLDGITRIYPSLVEAGIEKPPYRLGNIAAGDFTIFILEFTVAGIARPPSKARIAQVGLAGNAPGLGRREEFPLQDLTITFTEDESAVASVDTEVLSYVQQKNVDRLLDQAVQGATRDVAGARQTLLVAASMTRRAGNTGMTRLIEQAITELDSTGSISVGTGKTVRVGGRTKTVRTGSGTDFDGAPSEEEIRKVTGA
jgi:Ca-activated chloride channel family protein